MTRDRDDPVQERRSVSRAMSENSASALETSSGSIVIAQEPTEPQAAAHAAALRSQRFGGNQSVVNPLVIPLSMVVFEECRQGLPEANLADRHQAFQTFFFDGPHKSLRVGIAVRRLIRRLHDADARVREQAPKCPAPLGITVADQH